MPRYIGFDIETTGLEWKAGHKIIELAAIIYDETGKKLGQFVQRYNPQRPIDQKAQDVHGITFEEVSSCKLFNEDAEKLSTLLNSADLIVAHNGQGFDMPFLNHELTLAGVPPVNRLLLDTCLKGTWATPFGKLPNLAELCFACEVQYDTTKAHAANYDVEVMMDCFFKVGNLPGNFWEVPASIFMGGATF
jgi:DNA polymerase-3 subunit epsilon